jgi:hypothetical protein
MIGRIGSQWQLDYLEGAVKLGLDGFVQTPYAKALRVDEFAASTLDDNAFSRLRIARQVAQHFSLFTNAEEAALYLDKKIEEMERTKLGPSKKAPSILEFCRKLTQSLADWQGRSQAP